MLLDDPIMSSITEKMEAILHTVGVIEEPEQLSGKSPSVKNESLAAAHYGMYVVLRVVCTTE